MVDVFIIHSGSVADYVLSDVVPTLLNNKQGEEKACHTNVLFLGSDKLMNEGKYDYVNDKIDYPNNFTVRPSRDDNWKKVAKACIKKAQVVIVVVGEDIAAKEKTIGYEVGLADKYNKLIMFHKVKENTVLPAFLTKKDPFTGINRPLSMNYSLDQIYNRIRDYDIGYYNIFSDDKYKEQEPDKEVLGKIMEQYKMYQKTSEDLVSRRQSVSSFYITVNSALITVSGIMLNLVDFPSNVVVIILIAIVGIILDFSWIHILDAYGLLNSAKMKVIRMMEKELPISLYDTEWAVMSDKLNQKKYVSFTDSEKRVPRMFAGVYALVLIGVILYYFITVYNI